MYTSCVKPNTVYTKLVVFWQDFSVFICYNDIVEIQSKIHTEQAEGRPEKGRLFVCVSDGRQKTFQRGRNVGEMLTFKSPRKA